MMRSHNIIQIQRYQLTGKGGEGDVEVDSALSLKLRHLFTGEELIVADLCDVLGVQIGREFLEDEEEDKQEGEERNGAS